MAKPVDKIPIPHDKGAYKYPWDQWLDGQVWELIEGEDCTPGRLDTLRTSAYSRARDRGLKLRTSAIGNKLYIQAYPDPNTRRT